jgi:hypothetical protein
LTVLLRDRLAKYCAGSGVAERSVIEDALEQYLAGTSDRDVLLARFDQLAKTMADDRRDHDLLAEAFGIFLRIWFAHVPVIPEASRAAARATGESRYKQFNGAPGRPVRRRASLPRRRTRPQPT